MLSQNVSTGIEGIITGERHLLARDQIEYSGGYRSDSSGGGSGSNGSGGWSGGGVLCDKSSGVEGIISRRLYSAPFSLTHR